ncbi:hypothetical protein FHR83_002876 [Actinoplanes campanulatus]|uniref:Uncharacterized protein n=1 Tax=Actinoplanes campanulatus TaxID=113559 RepID=A0A7W5FE76_9ACTN|nr:hypothetical protein [Actinoplanes campanulatus]MBB3095213.1 hypothetical protein [Actinoplanes campanulatus]GGN24181.1 hypothetical protein GCM10010109_39580 [Actinoplanes campanulatus]GID34817.1 hypothetical protein Aca09nite_13230 [Actinoplanes campanulatus]
MSPKRTRTGSPKRIASGEKVAKVDATAVRGPDAGSHKVTFSFHYADHGYQGAWRWPAADEAHELLRFLCNVGALTWNEVKAQLSGSKGGSHRKHHFQGIDTLCTEAQERIAQLRLDEVFGDEIFRFRVANRRRLWGFIAAGVFYILWWDAEHLVYPLDHD